MPGTYICIQHLESYTVGAVQPDAGPEMSIASIGGLQRNPSISANLIIISLFIEHAWLSLTNEILYPDLWRTVYNIDQTYVIE